MSFLRKSTFSKLISSYFKSLTNKNSQHVIAKKAEIHQQKQAITKRKAYANNAYSNLTFMCVVATGYYVYKELKESIKSKKPPYMYVPSVQAASSFEGAPLSGRRSKFNFIADVVETSAPAVVYIEIKDHRRVDFFTGRPTTISNGSGFIIDSNGLILTNAHVVTNKTNAKVEVKLIDGSIYQGQVEDIDLKSDLATVRIPAKKLPVMKLGNSSDLKPGEFVVAIGSPLALSNTVTSGVVSSTHRGSAELGLMGKDMVYIQTDAAITFGNSGGPLVNLDGEAIGVNSMKVTAGISFAIPIDYVKAFLKSATGPKKTNNQKRMYLGITMLTLTPQIIFELQQRNHDVPRDIDRGVLVWKVIYGSPAHLGGLLPGDIVTHIDGKSIQHSNDVYGFLEGSGSREMRLSVNRSGRKMEVIITPEDLS